VDKSLTTGHAAHIHAASPEGPRYDANQSPKDRKLITNGLWLCRECGDIVDKDKSPHPASLLRQWKSDHETMITEVRTKGYSQSMELLQAKRLEPAIAKKAVGLLEDRRALWASFDAEFPLRVQTSRDLLRCNLVDLRGQLPDGSPMDQILLALCKTIHVFFDQVEDLDFATLKCNPDDPKWTRFRDALATLRKVIGLQIGNLSTTFGIALSSDLKSIVPNP
jgi:hypothetical protein